jgi:hypothetical protein
MAKHLKTDWVIIATSGATVDGRVIEKVWLQDMAETYKESVYSAKIWPDHERWFGAQGKVTDLKVEPATDPALKGEIHLMAILAPSDDLVYANRRGKYTHSSIEVLKNFRGTGKFYLGGMAATDEPASVGTTELNFSADKDKFWISGNEISFSSAVEQDEETSLLEKFTSLLKHSKGESRDTAMDKEQFNQLTETQNKTNTLLEELIGHFTKKEPAPAPAPAPTPKTEPAPTEQFDAEKALKDLSEKFTKLSEDFASLQKEPVPGTQPAGDDASANTGVIC